ncbi:unnamed protein product [Spirodela intermedia]|uniref:Uncharacterized protein n=1 Tax=Spirodela intermedia TaxID=51605 RepID=A0A7I8J9M5_SPIIN|nr:unnamed protein product [Spirodela intermedia]CAA6666465.1 unnamed protein product [Spirodela intermedia]
MMAEPKRLSPRLEHWAYGCRVFFLLATMKLFAVLVLLAFISSPVAQAEPTCTPGVKCFASPGTCGSVDCASVCGNYVPGGAHRACCTSAGRCCCLN